MSYKAFNAQQFMQEAQAQHIKSIIDNWRFSGTQYDTYALARLYGSSPYMYTAGNIWADAISQIGFKAYEGDEELPAQHPLSRLVASSSRFTNMMRRNELSMRFFGWTLDYIRYTQTDRPYELAWVNPTIVNRDSYYRNGLQGWSLYTTTDTGTDVVEIAGDINYISTHHALFFNEVDFFDDFDGVSSAEASLLSVLSSVEIDTVTLSTFRNGAVPALAIQPETDVDVQNMGLNPAGNPVDRMKEVVTRWLKGAGNVARTIVTPTRWKYQQLQPPFKDLNTTVTDELLASKIAIAFNVPISFIMPKLAPSGLSRSELAKDWAENSLEPRAKMYASIMTERLCHPYYGENFSIRVDRDTIPHIQPTVKEKYEIARGKFETGAISLQQYQVELEGKSDENLGETPLIMVNGELVPSTYASKWSAFKLQIAPSTTSPGMIPPNVVAYNPDATPQDIAQIEAQAEQDRAEADVIDAETSADETDDTKAKAVNMSRHVTYDEYKELDTYTEFIRRKGFAKARDGFTFEHVPQNIVRYINDNYDPDNTDADVFAKARQRLAMKAISSVEADAEADYRRLLERAQAERMPESVFRERFRTTIGVHIERGFEAGLIEGGVTDGQLTQEDIDTIRSLKLSMTPIVRRLARDIYSDNGISDDEIARKPRMWVNGTVRPAYSRGLDSARYNPMMQWRLGSAEEHCPTCKKLDGQRHRRNIWRRHNLEDPPRVGQATDCGGYECKCDLEVTEGRARGSIKSAFEADELEHTH